MNDAARRAYEERFKRVTDYIYAHLDEEIDLNTLAEIACLSPHHWHRVYHAMRGETIAATVKRLRLHRAAYYLATTDRPVAEIAGTCGYPNLQSFNRIFKSAFGMPPAAYRKNGSHRRFLDTSRHRENAMYDVETRTLAEMKGVGVDHTGPYITVGKAFETLYGCLMSRGLFRPDMQMVGIYYSDPTAVPEDELKSRACLVFDGTVPAEAPLVETVIPETRCAVLTYKGPYADMKAAYDWLFGQWLPQSGAEPGDRPCFEIYLNNPRDTPPTELLTEICLPLKDGAAA